MSKTAYQIRRFYFESDSKVIKKGLSLEDAKAHCKSPETSSKTCTSKEGLKHLEEHGQWFDGYEEE